MIIQSWQIEDNKEFIKEFEAKQVCGGIFDKYLLQLPDSIFAIYDHENEFFVIESTSGCSVGKGATKNEALADARSTLATVSIDNFINTTKASARGFDRLKAKYCKTPIKLEQKLPKRALVFKKNNGKCFYCDDQLEIDAEWHIEHKQPKSKGGTNDIENLVPSCRYCNLKKHDKTAKEFLEASV